MKIMFSFSLSFDQEYLEDGHKIGLEQELEEDEDEDEEEDFQQFDESEEEDCYEDTCAEEAYPGLRNVGLLGKVVKTLSYLTQGRGAKWTHVYRQKFRKKLIQKYIDIIFINLLTWKRLFPTP